MNQHQKDCIERADDLISTSTSNRKIDVYSLRKLYSAIAKQVTLIKSLH